MTVDIVEFLFYGLMDLCVCYDLVEFKYLSRPNNIVFL